MRSNPDIDALVRRAQEAGAKVLSVQIPGPEPAPSPAAHEGGPTPKPSKYRNVRTEYAGQRYDSKAEADYAEVLDLEMRITPGMFWVRQPVFHLGVSENLYRADFIVYRPIDDIRVVDVKGHRTAKFEHDVKLWRSYGPCPLEIVRRERGGWSSEVIPGANP